MSQSHRKHENPFIDYEHRTTRLEGAIENINTTIIDIKNTLGRIEGRLDKLDSRLWMFMLLIMTTLLGSFAGIWKMMAHGFHWI